MRRAYSIHELRQYLERRADDKEFVSNVIARLRENNYLDDARYAFEFARSHAQSRRQGRYRIARDLRARGVPDRHIDAALNEVFADTDEGALVRARLKRRLASIRGPIDDKKLASLQRSLLAAGFPSEVIRTELRQAIKDLKTPPEISDSAGDLTSSEY